MITRQPLVSSGVMSKRMRIALTITLGVVALALAGGAAGLVVAQLDEPAAATASDDPTELECANIQRAYQSWATGRLGDMYEYNTAAGPIIQGEIDDQRELLEAVQGYDGQASKELATAVATFGSELATLSAELTIAGQTSLDMASNVANAQKTLRSEYAEWKATTCG